MSGTKLVTSGEGGLVTFRDPADAERFSFLRVYGFKGDYNCRYIGLNGKLSELNAALGWLSLDLLEEAIDRRNSQVERYHLALADSRGIAWQATPINCVHGYKDLAVRFRKPEQRAAAEAALTAAGVMTKRYFFPVHRMEVYKPFAVRCASCHRLALRTSPLHPPLLRFVDGAHRHHRRSHPREYQPSDGTTPRCLNVVVVGCSTSSGHRSGLPELDADRSGTKRAQSSEKAEPAYPPGSGP